MPRLLVQHPHALTDGQPDTWAVLGGALEDAPRRVEIIARIQHKFDPQAVTTPLLDLEVAAVGVDRAVGLLVEGDVVGLDSYRPR